MSWQGFFWVANCPEVVFEWSTAGASRRFAPYGQWHASLDDGVKSGALSDDAALGHVYGGAKIGCDTDDAKSEHANGDARSGTVISGGSSCTAANPQSREPSAAASASMSSAVPTAAEASGKERTQRLVFIGIDLQKVSSREAAPVV